MESTKSQSGDSASRVASSDAIPVAHGGRLTWLDALKGLAMLWIFWNHASEKLYGFPLIANPSPAWPPLHDRFAQLLPSGDSVVLSVVAALPRWIGWFGDQGVQVFLVVSGFGLTWALVGGGSGEFSAPAFYRRRLLRIFPLWWAAHLVVLLGSYLLTLDWMFPTDPELYASLLGLRITPHALYYGSPSWWFIGLLLQLYAVFPLLFALLRRKGPWTFLVIACAVGFIARTVGLAAPGAWMDAVLRGNVFASRLPEFALGMAFALLLARDRMTWERRLAHPFMLLGAVTLWVAATFASLTLAGMVFAPLALAAADVVLLRWLLLRTGRLGLLAWIGANSYGLYLFHQVWIDGFVAGPGSGVSLTTQLSWIVVAGVATCFSARGVEVLVERVVAFIDRARRARVVLAFAGSAALLIAVLLGGEALVRALDPQEVLGWGERPALEPHERYGWTLRPNAEERLRWEGYDYEVLATEEGFPRPLLSDSSSSDALRILTLGDAFTSAEGVQPMESWPRRLEILLEEELEGRAVEVANFAITGYGPRQYAAVARDVVPRLRPDLVLVASFVNDFEDALISDEQFRESIGFDRADPDRPTQWLRLHHLRRWIEVRLTTRFQERWLGELDQRRWYFAALSSFDRENETQILEGARQFEGHLEEIAHLTSQSGGELILLLLPASLQVVDPAELDYLPHTMRSLEDPRFDAQRPQRLALGMAARLGLRTVDLRPALAGAPPRSTFFADNMHWTPDAHDRVARHVASILRRWDADTGW